eukprot:gb/GEZN01010245.1/.p1 GENE.gb/GEZN01010245.1/~~gb/GEZN01010245.1/.p1  ORF type:complete len:397 (-),score=42.12 gb/GEZN01010245.1/:42-1232(-)
MSDPPQSEPKPDKDKDGEAREYLAPKPDSKSKVEVCAHARKGAKAHQEDSFYCWSSPNHVVLFGGIWDGHGGYNGRVASKQARQCCKEYLEKVKDICEKWTPEEWKTNLITLFDTMHWWIRESFLNDNSQLTGSKRRYVDAKQIIRNPEGEPVHGGTTCTVAALIVSPDGKRNIVTANVGDSTGLLIGSDGKFDFLTVDHGPENPDEYKRVQAAEGAIKLMFVYDKTNVFRKYECPLVFLESGERDPKYIANPWGNGLHPTNVRYEPAVYAVTPRSVSKDSCCIAMTRALGDFYAHQFGLTNKPDVSIKTLDPNLDYQIHLASDGIWDCWKYDAYRKYAADLEAEKTTGEILDTILNESIQRAVTNFGHKHFDDASLVLFSSPRTLTATDKVTAKE